MANILKIYYVETEKLIKEYAYSISNILAIHCISLNDSLSLQSIKIEKNIHGKPFCRSSNLFFSISHCNNYVICAISDQEVGIDLEKKKIKNEKLLSILDNENKKLFSNPFDLNSTTIWAIREACLKRNGMYLKWNLKYISNGYFRVYFKEKDIFQNILLCNLFDDYTLAICTNEIKIKNILEIDFSELLVSRNTLDKFN